LDLLYSSIVKPKILSINEGITITNIEVHFDCD
jgi:hypothetical protein